MNGGRVGGGQPGVENMDIDLEDLLGGFGGRGGPFRSHTFNGNDMGGNHGPKQTRVQDDTIEKKMKSPGESMMNWEIPEQKKKSLPSMSKLDGNLAPKLLLLKKVTGFLGVYLQILLL